MQRNTAAAGVGARVLGEIEETTLDEVLASLRATFPTTTTKDTTTTITDAATTTTSANPPLTQPKTFPLPALNALVHRHFRATHCAPLSLTGRHRELLYPLIATLIAPPHNQAVSIVDFEGRFDPVRLLSTPPFPVEGIPGYALRRADLLHVHVLRPPPRGPPGHVAAQVAQMEGYMLYGAHASRGREWWGTVVIGGGTEPAGGVGAGGAAQVAVTADWRGWMRVERVWVRGFGEVGVEEALEGREGREREVEQGRWVGVSPWGSVGFGGVGGGGWLMVGDGVKYLKEM
ncbi:hypothetical protein C8A05DRAFT_43199 [Staphylotrichum tortipilum]|uniref:Uncharacterized protein n=1 Tax=Staphylotrichum tortipilum TaxID=2831512 RepID=A0AAN6MMX9_9PEZI|nr:hypothetical protein C8A05DRAFT_43199 [Staphylotrichum longicolle]